MGLHRRVATEFSFLLGIPTLLAAGGLQVYSAQKKASPSIGRWC
jgi:undecaprenyl-diphosphatase